MEKGQFVTLQDMLSDIENICNFSECNSNNYRSLIRVKEIIDNTPFQQLTDNYINYFGAKSGFLPGGDLHFQQVLDHYLETEQLLLENEKTTIQQIKSVFVKVNMKTILEAYTIIDAIPNNEGLKFALMKFLELMRDEIIDDISGDSDNSDDIEYDFDDDDTVENIMSDLYTISDKIFKL